MQVVTTCAPLPSSAEPKTAAAKQAPCQQAADQAADFAWLGIKLKSSQTPGRQAQRTQQVCNASASELQTEMKPARIAITEGCMQASTPCDQHLQMYALARRCRNWCVDHYLITESGARSR